MKNTKEKIKEMYLAQIKEKGFDFVELEPWHYRLVTRSGFVDFYPTTGKWFILKTRKWGVGFNALLEELK